MDEEIINEELLQLPKKQKTKKIVIAMSISLAIIIIVSLLLIGHFKLNWFQNEIYNIDIKISRNKYQSNFFSDKKTIKTKVGFTNGKTKINEFNVFTDFMVIQTDKTRLNNEKDFINNATLVILGTKVNIKNEQKDIISFNIFNETIINEFKSNPNGEKYPIAKFSYNENGTIVNIQLPNDINNFNANNILELIEKIIPKLTRNKTEDMSNGLKIKTKKDRTKVTLVESHSPKIIDKFKGSKFVKSVQRDFEKDHLIMVTSSSNLDLKTQKDQENIDFGFNNFTSEENSVLTSTEEKEEKEIFELIKKLSEYYTFIDSKDLIQLLKDEENRENEKHYTNKQKGIIKSEKSELRKLDFESCVFIRKINVLGLEIKLEGCVKLDESKYGGGIKLSVQDLQFYFGSDKKSYGYSHYYGDWTLFRFQFPPMPAIGIALKAGGTITIKQSFNKNDNPRIVVTVSGSLDAKAEITAGWEKVVSISVGAEGTIISSTLNGNQNDDKRIYFTGKIHGGDVNVYVEGKALDLKLFNVKYKIFGGFTKNV